MNAGAFAVGLSQEIGGARTAVGDDIDVHGYLLHHYAAK